MPSLIMLLRVLPAHGLSIYTAQGSKWKYTGIIEAKGGRERLGQLYYCPNPALIMKYRAKCMTVKAIATTVFCFQCLNAIFCDYGAVINISIDQSIVKDRYLCNK